MKNLTPSLLALVLIAAGCGKSSAPAPAPAPKAETPVAAAEKPRLHGVVQDILADRSSLVIKHEEIPGVMRGMTMAFRVDAATLQAAKKGQEITGDFESSGMNFSLSNVKLGAAPANPPAAAPEPAMPMMQGMGGGQGMMPGMKMDMPPTPAPGQPAGRN